MGNCHVTTALEFTGITLTLIFCFGVLNIPRGSKSSWWGGGGGGGHFHIWLHGTKIPKTGTLMEQNFLNRSKIKGFCGHLPVRWKSSAPPPPPSKLFGHLTRIN